MCSGRSAHTRSHPNIQIRTSCEAEKRTTHQSTINSDERNHTNYKWDDQNIIVILGAINSMSALLHGLCFVDDTSGESVDLFVEKFFQTRFMLYTLAKKVVTPIISTEILPYY